MRVAVRSIVFASSMVVRCRRGRLCKGKDAATERERVVGCSRRAVDERRSVSHVVLCNEVAMSSFQHATKKWKTLALNTANEN